MAEELATLDGGSPAEGERKKLPLNREFAAALDAQGKTSVEIAEIMAEHGMDISHNTIRNKWRPTPEYRAAVAEYQAGLDIDGIIRRGVAQAVGAVEKALEVELELLEAVDADGNPQHGMRHTAAKELMTHARGMVQATKKEEKSQTSIAVGSVNLTIGGFTPRQPTAEERQDAEIFDGEVIEEGEVDG